MYFCLRSTRLSATGLSSDRNRISQPTPASVIPGVSIPGLSNDHGCRTKQVVADGIAFPDDRHDSPILLPVENPGHRDRLVARRVEGLTEGGDPCRAQGLELRPK